MRSSGSRDAQGTTDRLLGSGRWRRCERDAERVGWLLARVFTRAAEGGNAMRWIPVVCLVSVFSPESYWAQANPRGRSEVRGVVVGPDGRRLAGALLITGTLRPESVVTDSLGYFRFPSLALGAHSFAVRRVGFQPATFEVEFHADTTVELEVPLAAGVTVLDSIIVRGDSGAYSRRLRFVGFEERREQAERSATDATFITPEEIAQRHAARLSHLLEGRRSIRIEYIMNVIAVPRGRDGRCEMSVWVDGQLVSILGGPSRRPPTDLFARQTYTGRADPGASPGLDMINVNEVAAVEIYPSPSGTPPQFQSLTGTCGAIVVWTKQ